MLPKIGSYRLRDRVDTWRRRKKEDILKEKLKNVSNAWRKKRERDKRNGEIQKKKKGNKKVKKDKKTKGQKE